MRQYKLEYLLLADAASVDNFGKLNLLGIFQNIFLQKIPGAISKFTIVVSVSTLNLEKSFILDIKIKDEKGNNLSTNPSLRFPFRPQTSNKDSRVNVIVDLINLEFKSFGQYEIQVLVENEKIGSAYLQVIEKKEQSK